VSRPEDVDDPVRLERQHCAHNYAPLPVTVARAEGAWVEAIDGTRYLDFLSAYSALNFGHRHPRLVEAARRQLESVTLTSRAVHNDQLGPFSRDLAELCGMDAVLPMNTGAEAVETAIKVARRWAYEVKGVPDGRAGIVVCDGSFHGRTTTIVGFSTDPSAREHFGPFAPGFVSVPFGDADAVRSAIDEHTAAVLVEPVQGEAGVVVPPAGYLRELRGLCTEAGVLLVLDEVQTGFGRTGALFAADHEGVQPDILIVGKALGGGIVPMSAVVANWAVLGVLTPGSHGSTFGGNPLACAIGREVIAMMRDGAVVRRAAMLGDRLQGALRSLATPVVAEVRGKGLWAAIELAPECGVDARQVCEVLLGHGLIVKETHGRTLRLAPPLVIDEEDLDWAIDRIVAVVEKLGVAG
jgi:ornithine--oxo-acid transaminase